MDWLTYTKIIPTIITLVLLYIIAKSLKDAIKDDKDGKPRGKCDLD